MKLVVTMIGFIAVAIAIFFCLAIYYPAWKEATPPSEQAPVVGERGQAVQLSRQVADLERSLIALKAQMAAQQGSAAHAVPTSDVKLAEPLTVEEQRASDAEHLRTYMAGVEQAFANEKVDVAWASGASSRVGAAFESDEVLRNVAHTVECRQQSCRVQIEDDGSGRLSGRMPYIAIGVADVLPQISAQHIDHGNGRGAMVLYMSSQRLSGAPKP